MIITFYLCHCFTQNRIYICLKLYVGHVNVRVVRSFYSKVITMIDINNWIIVISMTFVMYKYGIKYIIPLSYILYRK